MEAGEQRRRLEEEQPSARVEAGEQRRRLEEEQPSARVEDETSLGLRRQLYDERARSSAQMQAALDTSYQLEAAWKAAEEHVRNP